jgi:hypothetical protein
MDPTRLHASLPARSDLSEAELEKRLVARLEELDTLAESDSAQIGRIALGFIEFLHEITGITMRPPVVRLTRAMAWVLAGRNTRETVDRLLKLDESFYFSATMFGGKGYASALVCHLASALSSRRPDFKYVVHWSLRLLERRVVVERDDIAVRLDRAAAMHAVLSALAPVNVAGQDESGADD